MLELCENQVVPVVPDFPRLRPELNSQSKATSVWEPSADFSEAVEKYMWRGRVTHRVKGTRTLQLILLAMWVNDVPCTFVRHLPTTWAKRWLDTFRSKSLGKRFCGSGTVLLWQTNILLCKRWLEQQFGTLACKTSSLKMRSRVLCYQSNHQLLRTSGYEYKCAAETRAGDSLQIYEWITLWDMTVWHTELERFSDSNIWATELGQ